MTTQAILQRLAAGPATNLELQEAVCDHSGGVARTCSKLIHRGRVVRVDGATGRGAKAVYALAHRPLSTEQGL